MSKKRPGTKSGDTENTPRWARLLHDEMDSMAFKTLNPAAVWLLMQLRRAWTYKGRDQKIELPFARVSWKLTFPVFDKARRELIEAGFIRIVDPGGLLRRPTVYAMSEGWREISKDLARNPAAGYLKNIRMEDGSLKSVWYPTKKRQTSTENVAKAWVAIRQKKTGKKKPLRIYHGVEADVATAGASLRRSLKKSLSFLEERTGILKART